MHIYLGKSTNILFTLTLVEVWHLFYLVLFCQLPFPAVGSLNGVQMFAKNLEAKLLSTCTDDAKIVWHTFHERLENYNNNDLEFFLILFLQFHRIVRVYQHFCVNMMSFSQYSWASLFQTQLHWTQVILNKYWFPLVLLYLFESFYLCYSNLVVSKPLLFQTIIFSPWTGFSTFISVLKLVKSYFSSILWHNYNFESGLLGICTYSHKNPHSEGDELKGRRRKNYWFSSMPYLFWYKHQSYPNCQQFKTKIENVTKGHLLPRMGSSIPPLWTTFLYSKGERGGVAEAKSFTSLVAHGAGAYLWFL